MIPVGGFNPARVRDLSRGIEVTLGMNISKAVVFDRDFRSDEEVAKILRDLGVFATFAHIHERKEIENYLLVPAAIKRAIEARLRSKAAAAVRAEPVCEDIEGMLRRLTEEMKSRVNAQFMSKRQRYLRECNPALDQATLNQEMLEDFDAIWSDFDTRLEVVPGKDLLASLSGQLQSNLGISLTTGLIVRTMRKDEVPAGMLALLGKLDDFRGANVS